MDRREHWNGVYAKKAPDEVSWFAAHLAPSLDLLREVAGPDSAILDVGAGASTLVDDLLDLDYRDVSVLDVSERALDLLRARLGPRAERVHWLRDDVTSANLPKARYDVWHDRAVFHFLTEADDRRAYVGALASSLRPRGHAIMATFGPRGPTTCSGLPVVRYDPDGLSRELGSSFVLEASREERHVTPAGKEQAFVFCRFRSSPAAPGRAY